MPQRRERLALGYGRWEYVVCNEVGEPYSPQVLSRGWRKTAKRAGVRDELDEPTRPTYRVRAHDTLRSIARDTFGDSHRYREILDLNREVIDDPTRLVSGQSLILPEDAIVRDRPR